MNFYEQLNTSGQLWLRTPKGDKLPANIALSSIFSKYETINSSFYFDLTENNIQRFDVIQDTLFVETSSGFIFEKFYVDDFTIKPYSNANLFQEFYNSKIDYWYNESDNKIYYVDVLKTNQSTEPVMMSSISNSSVFIALINNSSTLISSLTSTSTSFVFLLKINKFDCYLGKISSPITYKIQIGINTSASEWSESQYNIENPKITHNPDTNTYNTSFILKNYNNKMGLISVNFQDNEEIEITEINGFLPYLSINFLASNVLKT